MKFTEVTPNPMYEGADTARFRIEGLTQVRDGEFELRGIKPLLIDFPAVEGLLQEAGLAKTQAVEYTEAFMRMVDQKELCRVLAERMERVG